MTVSSTDSRKTYAGNGTTTSFATSPVIFYDTSDLVVYVTTDATEATELLVENTDYTVTGGSGAVGTVNTAGGTSPYGAPASGTTLVIDRQIPATQGADFVQNDSSDAEVTETALDRLTVLVQQLNTKVGRALRVADSNVTTTDTELTPEGDYALAWNAAGTAIVNVALSTGTTLADLAAASGASLIGYTHAGTGYSLTTIKAQLDTYTGAGAGAYFATNIASGIEALNSTTTGQYNAAFGKGALKANTTGGYNVAIGLEALTTNTTGAQNVAIGPLALQLLEDDGVGGVGNYNVAIGYAAGQASTVAGENVIIGFAAMSTNTAGSYNVAVGAKALQSNDGATAHYNVAVGHEAMNLNETGISNVAVGTNALKTSVSGQQNVAIGIGALQNSTATGYNVAVGGLSLNGTGTGANNTGVGYLSLGTLTNGANNTAIGYKAGGYITGGSTPNTTSGTSVYLGAESRAKVNGGANEIVIGYQATGNGDNTVTLGNASVTGVLTAGTLTVKNATATSATNVAAVLCGTTAGLGLYFGTGSPASNSVSAAKGSLFMRVDGAGTTSRAYVNTDGSTAWTNLTAAA